MNSSELDVKKILFSSAYKNMFQYSLNASERVQAKEENNLFTSWHIGKTVG